MPETLVVRACGAVDRAGPPERGSITAWAWSRICTGASRGRAYPRADAEVVCGDLW